MSKPVKLRLEWPLAMTCGKCGATANGYPFPNPPYGVLCCPNCSPSWLEGFARWCCEQRGLLVLV